MKICVADDEKAVRKSIINKLKSIVPLAQIFDVGFGFDSLEQILTVQPDLVFLDIRMPELDGLEVLRKVKQSQPYIQAVILSGYNEFEYAINALQLGAIDYLLKPADRGKLAKIIMKVKMDMDETFLREVDTDLVKLSSRFVFIDKIRCFNTSLWFDERQAKKICFGDRQAPMIQEYLSNPENIMFTCSVKNDYEGLVIKTSENYDAVFRDKGEFLNVFQERMVKWETERFFGGHPSIQSSDGKKKSNLVKQAAQLRKSILNSAKETNYKDLESFVSDWLDCIRELDITRLKKECVNLMALLDEGLASKNDFILLEEEKVYYWMQWVEQYKTWNDMEKNIKKFVLGGVRALITVDNESNAGWFDQAMRWIESSRDPNPTLDSVAAAVGVHPVTLSRIFKQKTGMNFIKFLVKRRLQHSQTMLLKTKKSIGEIAEEIGYIDCYYFRNLFKKEFGLTPAEYRKQNG